MLIRGICTRFECDRNRASPRATSCRARSMFCRSPVLPWREPLSPPFPAFDPPPPQRPSRRRAFGEYGSALTILPSVPPRVSTTGMIYAAAFHIFHCFQVFGSICKIKFVMREHILTRAIPSPPCHSVTLASPVASPPFAARRERRRIWRTGQFPPSCWNIEYSERSLACKLGFSSPRMPKSLPDISVWLPNLAI